MKGLDIEQINSHAPYVVKVGALEGMYSFEADSGAEFSVGFMPDDLVMQDESYEFIIGNLNGVKSPRDHKVKETVIAIVEEFFNANKATMLFLCSTTDGKQLMRGRLFKNWFETFERRNRFTMIISTLVDENGADNVAAVIIRNDNPNLGKVLAEFGETIEMFSHKPNMANL